LYIRQNEFDIAAAVVVIDLRLIGDIEEIAFEQLLFEFREAKPDAADGRSIVCYCQLQVFTS
jgi:hypothetical protein